MSASFASASSQRIYTDNPGLVSTGYPLTLAAWVSPASASVLMAIAGFANTGTSDNLLGIRTSGSNQFNIVAQGGGSLNAVAVALTYTTGLWYFIIGRFISSTNRRISGVGPAGSASASGTLSRAPTGLNRMSVGAFEFSTPNTFMNGRIAEFWYADADIYPDGAVNLPDAYIRQLAFGGPFSIPSVAKSVVEYRSFRAHTLTGEGQDVYFGPTGVKSWADVNGASVGAHPPLPYWYQKPGQRKRQLIV